ncbi:hypothetical protein BKA69DRAFT_361663 [Paraphysoderma sedebokerense]|nr:hypothetical protein BKA69DRAFT_361663 [Paraphysoderma sedebokerense]
MAEKAKAPPRKRRKKGQFTVHILGQPPRHFYPEEFRDMPMAKSTICASLAATLPNNGQFLSAALQSCQELPQTAPNLEGVIVTDETACLVEESPMCGLNRQEDTVDVPETHCSDTLANLCDAECSDTQWDDNYDPAFQDVDIATPAFATDPIPSIPSIRPSASTSHNDYATQLKELYYSRLMFLSTERYIQSLYFDLSSRLHIIAMLDFELEDGNLSIHPHPAKLRIVAIQATYFKNQEIGILRACDCTARSNQFRSVFLGQDFRSESLAPFAEESSSNDGIHSSVATRFLSDVREKHHDSSVVFESLQTPNQDPQKVDFLPDVYVTHDSRDRYFYSICYRKSKWRCLGCPNTTFCRHISYTRGMLVHDGEQNKNDTDQDNNSRVEIPDLPLEWEDRGCPEIQSITCRTYPSQLQLSL